MSKTEIFSDQQNLLAQMMKALGHPARIAIVQHLLKAETCICNDLVIELGLAQATISQHLRELKKVGLLKGTIEGSAVCYCIDTIAWENYRATFEIFFLPGLAKQECC